LRTAGADVIGDGVELCYQNVHVAGVGLRVLLQRGVEVGDVGVVVFTVVEAHGLLVYSRLQGVVAVR
jgi:hypothetical protein